MSGLLALGLPGGRFCVSASCQLPPICRSVGFSDSQLRFSHTERSPRAPMVLVLDVDETLLRAKVHAVHANRKLAKVDATVVIRDGPTESIRPPTAGASNSSSMSPVRAEAEKRMAAFLTARAKLREQVEVQPRTSRAASETNCDVSLRPGVERFFDWIRERRKDNMIEGPWIFSQGSGNYLRAMLPLLDPDGDLFPDRVLSRSACSSLPKPWPWVLKDLRKVPMTGKLNLERVVLVDNNSMSAILHPDNTLMLRDWSGDGRDDDELDRVANVLDTILERANSKDEMKYSQHLVAISPRHAEFRRDLQVLHRRLLTESRVKIRTVKDRDAKIAELWEEACRLKRELLGLGPGEY